LKSAAYTYVVAALSSLATLVYYILVYSNRRD
jgi:Zn-dependent membrane protease YugP